MSTPLDKTRLKRVARRALSNGEKIAKIAVHLTAATTTLGKLGAAVGIADAVLGKAPSLHEEFSAYPAIDISTTLSRGVFDALLRGNALKQVDEQGKEIVYALPVHEGGQVVWIRGADKLYGPWAKGCTLSLACVALGRGVWEALGPSVTLQVSRWGDKAHLEADKLATSLPSAQSVELAENLRSFHAAGFHRSVLLYGPPGTGKSYISRDVSQKLGGLSLRHKVTWSSAQLLGSATELLCPTTVILDDFDRSPTSSMLDALEHVKVFAKTVLVSANYTDKIDPAMRRPGRFDESIFVNQLDQVTFDGMTHGVPETTRKLLRPLPAAYIQEYVTVRTARGDEAAEKRARELVALAAEICASEAPEIKADND